MKLTYDNVRYKIWTPHANEVWEAINAIPSYRASLARSAKYDIAEAVEFTCKEIIWMGVYETSL